MSEKPVVSLDKYGVLRCDDLFVALAPAEQTVMRVLLAHFGRVVPREQLNMAMWPDRAPDPTRRQIDVLVYRLRRRIEPIGLAIATIRTQGFLLHWQEASVA